MDQIHAYGLDAGVVESVNVHDDIRIGLPTRDALTENYKQCVRNLGKFGVIDICSTSCPSTLALPLIPAYNTVLK